MRICLFFAVLAMAGSANAIIIPRCRIAADCPSPACGRGICDPEGFCDVIAVPTMKGRLCRSSTGPCDLDALCDGVEPECPDNPFSTAEKECRPSAGACDVAEHCTGRRPDCPADQLRPQGTTCRAVAGECDVAEVCDGSHAACPVDGFKAAGTMCRAAANDCDIAESCNGSSKDCPADSSAASGTACENASACISGGTCAALVCIGGRPELTFSPDPGEFSQGLREVEVAIKHTGSGAAITLIGASIDPPGIFRIAAAPQWPVSLSSGAEEP